MCIGVTSRVSAYYRFTYLFSIAVHIVLKLLFLRTSYINIYIKLNFKIKILDTFAFTILYM